VLKKLKEIKKPQKPFEDTKEAWFDKDKTGPENEDVRVGRFIWNRKKSNDNIIDTGDGDGKGFSFYYARCVDNDKFIYEAFNETNFENVRMVGIILVRQPGWLSLKSCKMPRILRFLAEVIRKLKFPNNSIVPNGNEKVMVAIDAITEGNLTRITSAWEVDNTSIWAKRYWTRRKFKESQTKKTLKNHQRLVGEYYKNKV
jgi:hypothetical protein